MLVLFIHSHARESKFCLGEDNLECIEVLHAEFRDAPTNSKKHQKVYFQKKARFLGQSQNTCWYYLLTHLLENELKMTHVDFQDADNSKKNYLEIGFFAQRIRKVSFLSKTCAKKC